ncbi:MAG: fumarylacetoacetate hydrolase family protein [Actinomycetota bacterium]|nr:fumarylacetoacetate hydrolase family protein [Actinomycetota bacterium]
MKIIRFSFGSKVHYGALEGEVVKAAFGSPFEDFGLTGDEFLIGDVMLLPPTLPSKVVAVGLNYIDHAKELNMEAADEPVIFIKPATSVIGPGEDIIYPKMSGEVDYEAELAIVIKDKIKDVSQDEAPLHILGFTCANDVTARDLQRKDGQWTRAKSFDTFCPLGPHIETELDVSDLKIELLLNGEIKQSSSTKNMIFDPYFLVSFVSQIMTLYPGDLIITGTPPGVGPMNKGDTVEVKIEGIGSLRNRLV